MATIREEIEELMVDCYSEDEEMSAWDVAFTDGVEVPFRASLLGIPVQVQGFRVNDANAVQCQVVRESQEGKGTKPRWIGVEDLDEEGLPDDFRHVMTLFRAWVEGDY